MAKKNKTLILLGIVLIALCAVYFGIVRYKEYSENKAAEQSKSEEEANKIIVSNRDNISKIIINGENGEIPFVKRNDRWIYEPDESFPLNTSMVTLIENDISPLEAVRRLEEREDLSSYGLEQPSYTVTVTDQDGNSETILIGAGSGENFYAMVQGGSDIYTIGSALVTAIDCRLNDFIALDNLPEFSEETIQNITVTNVLGTVAYQKQENTEPAEESSSSEEETGDANETAETEESVTWQKIKDGVSAEVEDSSISSAVGTLSSITPIACESYNTPAENLSSYGLDEASRTNLLIDYIDNNEEKTVIFRIGAMDTSGNYYYTMIEDSGKIQTMSATVIDKIVSAMSVN